MVGKMRTFSYSWIYDRTNVFALRIYPFHLMLQCALFRVMNMIITGTPCDIGFHWKYGDPRKIVPQGT